MTYLCQTKQYPAKVLVAVIALTCLLGCVSHTPPNDVKLDSARFDTIGPLPVDTRHASSLELVNGAPPEMPGAGTSEQDTSLLIDSDGLDYSYGRYVFGLPQDATLNGLDINVDLVDSEYWVGLSGYSTTGGWEWHGPYTDDTRIDFDEQFANYLSPNDNLYWAVLTAAGHSVVLIDTTVDYDPFQIEFRVPPPGQQIAAPAPAGAPSMILMPQIEDWSDEGAPVIFYSAAVDSNPYIFFAYYNGTMWKQRRLIADGSPMSHPQAIWTGSSGTIFAYDYSAGTGGNGQLVQIDTDESWTVTSTEAIGDTEGKSLTHLKVDYDASSNDFLVLHAYSVDPLHEVYISQRIAGEWETAQPTTFTGDKIAGADVSFDPAGGQPWAVFSSGTIDDSDTIILDFRLNMGRFNGATWDWSTIDNDEPLSVDLGFKADNTPQLVMISVRLWTFDWPIPPIHIEASVLADISVGEFNGSWTFTKLHESQLDISNFFDSQLGLDLGIDCSWATYGSLSYSNADGFVGFSTSPFAITDGTLLNHTKYFVDGGGGYTNSPFFTGDPGISFSWQLGTPGLMCAYLYAEEIDVTEALGGTFDLANDLIFWRPGG